MQVFLVNDVSYATGGATKVFLRCIAAVHRAGIDVVAFVGDDGAHLRKTFPEIRVVSLNEAPLRWGVQPADLIKKSFNLRAMRMLRGELNAAPRDTVVHFHGWMQILSPSVFYAIRTLGRAAMVSAHDFFLACPNGAFVDFNTGEVCRRDPLSCSCLTTNCDKRNYLNKLWRCQRTWLQKIAGQDFWSSVTVIAVHEKMENYLEAHRFRRVLVLRTPTDAFVAHRVDVKKNKAITFLGRMSWEKGIDILVEALRRIDQPAQLLGAGPLLEHVCKRSPQSYCPGWVKEEDVSSLLDQARLFVMPSRMPEPYGLVAVEAMMSGLPVVVGCNSLISEEVEASRAGIVYDTKSSGTGRRARPAGE